MRAVGLEFEFSGSDLGAVLLALEFTDTGDEFVGGAVEPLCLGVQGVDEAPQEVSSLIRKLRSVGCCFRECAEGLDDGGGRLALVPHGAVVELIRPGRGAEQGGLLAYHGGEGFVLRFVFAVLVHVHLLVVVYSGHRSLLWLSSSEGMVVLGQRVAEIVPPHFLGHLVEIFGCPLGGAREYVAVARKGPAVAAELAAVQVGEFVEVHLLLPDFSPQPSPVFLDDGVAVAVGADPEGISPLRHAVDPDQQSTADIRDIFVQVHHGCFHAFLLSRELTDALLSAPFSARKGIVFPMPVGGRIKGSSFSGGFPKNTLHRFLGGTGK